ncbi:5-hydroxytryptamine receptor-like [Hyalella azteca]|uniref:5-hydroxytryptamine receptor-like n=1 Tax=Hyalella azteca TaxID=294128 RepID=A0A8B7PPZ0_HYAAZ|nr:5-hydroxytryptamine receptor-like [Hyalella azteca]
MAKTAGAKRGVKYEASVSSLDPMGRMDAANAHMAADNMLNSSLNVCNGGKRRKIKQTSFMPRKNMQISLRPARNIQKIIHAQRKMRVKSSARDVALTRSPAEIRQRLARSLLALVVIFVVCWMPYSLSLVVWSCHASQWTTATLKVTLFLAYFHTALNPVVYWLMTQTFKECLQNVINFFSFCSCVHACNRCSCDFTGENNSKSWFYSDSSTNEDNLGPFHPRYTRPKLIRPQVSRYTSHYFH